MQPVSLSPAQKAQCEAAVGAIDWSKIDWSKLSAFLMILLQALLAQQPKQATPLANCDHNECCLKTLTASLETTAAAAHCYQTCCPTN